MVSYVLPKILVFLHVFICFAWEYVFSCMFSYVLLENSCFPVCFHMFCLKIRVFLHVFICFAIKLLHYNAIICAVRAARIVAPELRKSCVSMSFSIKIMHYNAIIRAARAARIVVPEL